MRTRLSAPLALFAATFAACAPPASEQPDPHDPPNLTQAEPQAYTSRATYPVGDEGTEAFIYRASEVVLGRPLTDVAELNAYLNAAALAGSRESVRRSAILDRMFLTETYRRRWAQFMGDHFDVGRTDDSMLGVSAGEVRCYAQPSGAPVTADLAQAISSRDPFDGHVAGASSNLHDVFESSVLADDLSASFYSVLLYLPSIRFVTDMGTHSRDALFAKFTETFLGRNPSCTSCHTTNYSVSGPTSGFDRHAPVPWLLERNVLGSDRVDSERADLTAEFRSLGYVATTFVPYTPVVAGGRAPWGLDPQCGTFLMPPQPESSCLPTDARCVGTGSKRRLGRSVLVGGATADSTTYRLYQKLALGIQSLRRSPPNRADLTIRPMDRDPRDSSGLVAERSFAYLVALRFVNAVWKETYGTSLILDNGFPRNAAQRDQLMNLVAVFVRGTKFGGPFSLQQLLREILLAAEFNAGTGSAPMPRLWNPFTLPDPRDPTATSHYVYPPAETCSGATPSYRSCARQVLTNGSCYHCHADGDSAPRLDYEDPFASGTFNANLSSMTECMGLAATTGCGLRPPVDPARSAPFTCADLFESDGRAKNGSRIAAYVSCSNPSSSQRMPRAPFGPLSTDDQVALWTWVKTGGRVGAALSLSAPLTTAETTNTVGDSLHWTPPAALARTIGEQSGLDYREPAFVATLAQAGSLSGAQYFALGVKHRVDSSWRAGFSGQDLVQLDNRVLSDSALFDASRGALHDALEEAIRSGWNYGQLIESLRLTFLGERTLQPGEWSILAPLLGGVSSTASVAAAAATDRVSLERQLVALARLWGKTPHALLSYRAPVQSAFAPQTTAVLNIPLEILLARSNLRTAASCKLPDWLLGTRPIKDGEPATLPAACGASLLDRIAPCAADTAVCRLAAPGLEERVTTCLVTGKRCDEIAQAAATTQQRIAQTLDVAPGDPLESSPAAWESAVVAVPWAERTVNQASSDVMRIANGKVESLPPGTPLKAGDVLVFTSAKPAFSLKGDPAVTVTKLEEPFSIGPKVAAWIVLVAEPKLLGTLK